jgi:ketosteroid isomerase-like protein
VTFAERKRLVRASYAAWSEGDFETLEEIYHPDCEWDNARLGLPDIPSISRGHSGMRVFWRTSVGAFDGDIEVELLQISDLPGERVAVTGKWKARHGERTGVLAALPNFGQLIEFHDGAISRVEYFPNPDEAMAVGARQGPKL